MQKSLKVYLCFSRAKGNMQKQHLHKELFNKIRRLPLEKVAVVNDFVEFLSHRGEKDSLVWTVGKLPEKSFQKIWDNQEDAEYDNL
jgi:hypothetical protein